MTLTTLLIAAASFLIGAGIGHLFSRKIDSSEKSVHKLQQKLRQSQDDLKNYQQEVTEHFVATAQLTGNVTQSQREFNEHLAAGAIRLANTEVGRQLLKASGHDIIDLHHIEVPRDYAPSVPGGVLNERYGFEESKAKKSPPDSLADNTDSDDDYDDRDPTQRVG
jgi:uncharacterized protein